MAARFLAVFAAAFLLVGPVSAATLTNSNRVERGAQAAAPVDKELLAKFKDGKPRFVVEFSAKADVGGAARGKAHAQRGAAVYKALTATAQASQAEAITVARSAKGSNPKSYWLTNSLLVTGDAKLARRLAALSGVTSVHAQKIYPLVKPVKTSAVIQAVVGNPEWGVEKIGADQAWADGITGQGITVANIDTGVEFSHEALVESYRGNNHDGTFSHDYNWWDPAGICGGEPCDNVGHGTHTMGTIAGGDGPGPFTPDTGVAPGASWFAAKGCEDLGCSSESLLSAGQFVLAPTDLAGNNADPSRRPDIVNNSWGSDDPNDTFYLEIVQAWRAAGIIPVFSAGNAGDFGCGTAGTPGNFTQVISLGATDIDDNIASFSSRGPSPTDKVSPNVSAPGVDVVSSVPGGGYAAFSGTSMASPHATGTIALMLSSDTSLIGDFGTVLDLLNLTAIDRPDDSCGTPDPSDNDPNFAYGEGRIDAKAAVDIAKDGGTLSGTVSDAETGDPIAGAHVTANNGEREFNATTDGAGNYSLFLAAGTYSVSASAFGYALSLVTDVVVQTDETTDQDFALEALPRFTVSGNVTASEDGAPLEGATVRAIGTPVPPATTDADGFYSLELPIGDYTLRASAGGCTEVATVDISLFEDLTQDFSLFRKLDDFGHGCHQIAFDWVDASGQTALYGDEVAGRLRLPFDFEFYGETYSAVWLSENGFINFLEPRQGDFSPSGIPSASPPNAGIYVMWQDFEIDEEASIDSEIVGESPNRAFVIEYQNIKTFGATQRATFEVKLWENGTIDMLYGANSPNPGDGRNAVIGIEDASGTDALQFSMFEDLLDPNTAFRYEHVPSGLVQGVVTDANDGEPISGATVAATPGGRSTTTGADGAYSLRLRPGSYTIEASAPNYVTAAAPATVVDESVTTLDFALAAAVAAVEPTEINETVDLGETVDVDVTLSNTGSAPLEWTVQERDQGVTLPDLPPASITVIRQLDWAYQRIPAAFPRVVINDTGSVPLSLIIEDPEGDSADSNDVVAVRAGSDGSAIASMSIDFSASTPLANVGGYVYLDVDQDASTGVPAEALFGLPGQDVGMEYFATLFEASIDGIVPIWEAETGELVAVVDAVLDEHTIAFDLPLEALGGDDGSINTAMVTGQFGPSDWAPDEGHGTIQPFSDAAWLSETPESGTIEPGESQVVTIHLGTPNLQPGEYHAQVVFQTNAPKQTSLPVDVTLTVNLPPEFGALTGVVTDAHSGEPLAGVLVTVHTTWQGAPFDASAVTHGEGAYKLVAPEGTWTADYTLDGYVPVAQEVTIEAGVTTSGADAAMHRIQPHAGLDESPLVFVLTPGRTDEVVRPLTNTGGHEDLTFSIGEVNLDAGAQAIAGVPLAQQAPTGAAASYTSTRALYGRAPLSVPSAIMAEGDVLARWPAVGLDLPWGVGYTGDVWLSDPIDNGDVCSIAGICTDAEFTTGGEPTGASFETTFGEWAADMAYDAGRGLLWQVSVGGDNGIYGIDPSDGSIVDVITGDPWTATSQRGLAYDPAADVFYIGGWNEGIVYRVAGPSHPTPGETLNQCNPADPNISGLAWNGSFQMLWAATNSDTDTIFLIDPLTCDTVRALPHPDGGGLNGAGIEMDVVGNLWVTGQNSGTVYLVESGLPNFSDIPWLTVEPTEGTVAPDGSTDLTFGVDTTGLAPGVYQGIVVVQTNDPDNANLQVPVTLVVPAYQQGIDPGTGSYLDPDSGVLYAADRAFTPGGFGYVGGSTRSTTADIAGTDRDPLYSDLRQGMTAYRFTVPNGTYRVDLAFAELQLKKAGARIFNVSIEGQNVLASFDVYDEAGGRLIALDRTVTIEVTDGVLDITFAAQRGDSPIVNGILVTEMPPGSEGL